MTHEEIIKFLSDNLRLEVKTEIIYTFSEMREYCKTVKLVLAGIVISEVDV